MAEFFGYLLETNLISAAFVIGAVAFIIAIIGRFKGIIKPSPVMRLVLGVFGMCLMALSVAGYFSSYRMDPEEGVMQVSPTDTPEPTISPAPPTTIEAPKSLPSLEPRPTPTWTLVPTTEPAPHTSAPEPTDATPAVPGWVVCWQGRAEHEYLIAYREVDAREGINLTKPMKRPWDGNVDDLTNDSLKMCLFDGIWYGSSPLQHFPFASHLRLEQDQIVVCENAPSCRGQQWALTPDDSPPSVIMRLLRQPSGNEMQILGFIESSLLP